jgi:Flp pilus assembly protein TadG
MAVEKGGRNPFPVTVMFSASLRNQFRSAPRRFINADRGNIAITFAYALVPILGFIGAAVDYSRANSARSSMQVALDSTALMLSKDLSAGTITTAQIATKASTYFTALYTNRDAKSVAITATYTASNSSTGSTVQVNGSGAVTTDFLKMVNVPNLSFNSSSTAAWGNTKMRVALALDNTGSMADAGKMTALIPAAKNLIDQLKASANANGDVYISIVPFSRDVNVGASNYNQSWLDFSDWDSANTTCSLGNFNFGNFNWGNWGNGGGGCTPAQHSTWNGCVTDRDQDYDIKSTPPTTGNAPTLFVAEQYSSCPVALMPLSYDWAALKAKIDTMTPNGNTNQAIGLAWGWLSLNQTSPLNAPAEDSNYTYKKAIILMTDGLNTQNRWTTNAATIDARQKLLCDNIKAAGITIYTVQVNTDGDPTQSVLQYCASGSDKFFVLTSASQIMAAFNSIGTSLSQLRIAK